MIKNFPLANEIASNMEAQLQPLTIKNSSNANLERAIDCLQAAAEIFEESGHIKQANQVITVLSHFGNKNKALIALPSVGQMMEAGITMEDFEKLNAGNLKAKAKLNKVLYDLGYSHKEIVQALGEKHLMKREDAEAFLDPHSSSSKLLRLIQDPHGKDPGTEINEGDEVMIHSVAGKIIDRHTKGLTSEKQLKNLIDHGTQFNLSDDNGADDLLALDIDDNDLEVLEGELMDMGDLGFEDEIS